MSARLPALDCLVALPRPNKRYATLSSWRCGSNISPTVARPRVQLSDLRSGLKGKIAQQGHAANIRLEEYITGCRMEIRSAPSPTYKAFVDLAWFNQCSSHTLKSGIATHSREWDSLCAPVELRQAYGAISLHIQYG